MTTTKWTLVSMIETSMWISPVVRKAGGAIARTYLFDANRHVHCCELTPSYELYPVDTFPWKDDDDGSLSDELRSHETNDVVYMHTRFVDGLPEANFHRWPEEALVVEEGETKEEVWERARESMAEHVRCNQFIAFPTGFQPSIAIAA